MISNIWRFFVALLDIRAWARILTGRPAIDVVFITNLRDEAERRRFFGKWVPPLGHANGPRMYLRGVAGRVRESSGCVDMAAAPLPGSWLAGSPQSSEIDTE